jgi:hypothetical protein
MVNGGRRRKPDWRNFRCAEGLKKLFLPSLAVSRFGLPCPPSLYFPLAFLTFRNFRSRLVLYERARF